MLVRSCPESARAIARAWGDRQRDGRAGWAQHVAVGADDLRVALGAAESRIVVVAARSLERRDPRGARDAVLAVRKLVRARAQGVVDLRVQLGADRDEDRRRGDEDGHGHREAGDGGDPVAERHGSRST
jgi:hypothetical protein